MNQLPSYAPRPVRVKALLGVIIGAQLAIFSPVIAWLWHRAAVARSMRDLAASANEAALAADVKSSLHALIFGGAGLIVGIVILTFSILAVVRDRSSS